LADGSLQPFLVLVQWLVLPARYLHYVSCVQVASQQRFSYREADLQRHEAELLHRLQHGSTITLFGSDGMRASHSSTNAEQASVPPVNAAQSVKDWEVFLELPDFLGRGKAPCSGGNGASAPARRRRVVHSSISSVG
jgi:hypothetical protein